MRLAWVGIALWLGGCAGAPLVKDQLNDSPGGLTFNGYTKPEVACFSCHNGDAKGSMRGPSLADPIHDNSDEQLRGTIKEGDGRMPAHKDRLSDEEIGQILEWLHSRFPAAPKPAEPKPAGA